MRKFFIAIVVIILMCLSGNVFAYNPNTFFDDEEVSVQGNRPKVDIEVSEVTVTVDPEDFVDGVYEKGIEISNEGNVPCRIKTQLKDVPVDLNVEVTVDDDILHKGETTNLNIKVELSDMQSTESFSFTIIVEASLR
jgi:hypothetical protein